MSTFQKAKSETTLCRYGDCVAACGYHIERFFSARLGECGPVVETNPLGSVREVGLEDLEEFRSRIPHVCEGDVETIYQVSNGGR